MRYQLDDTIAAIATAPGGAARAVVRLAGPRVVNCVTSCFTCDDASATSLSDVTSATSFAGQLQLDDWQRQLPCRLYLWPDQRSYARSPMAEIHMFGSPPLADAVLRTLCAHGARLAEPGEFTLRAFLSGRVDLTQAEAVLGVIDATGDAQLQVALRQLAGGLSGPLHALREELLGLLAELEAGLDFVEEDIEFITSADLVARLDASHKQIAALAEQMQQRSESSKAIRVVMVGSPNVGKSSLFNALIASGHPRQTHRSASSDLPGALVSAVAGTTRDFLTARIDLDDITCELIDTAGAAAVVPEDAIAAAAQSMTVQQRNTALLSILCLDATRPLSDWERHELICDSQSKHRLIALTKADLPRGLNLDEETQACCTELPNIVSTSSHTGDGLDELRSALRELIVDGQPGDWQVVETTAVRCHNSLRAAAEHLMRARENAQHKLGEELVAAELRFSLDELGQVVGAVYTDDILDRIFSRFCIGK